MNKLIILLLILFCCGCSREYVVEKQSPVMPIPVVKYGYGSLGFICYDSVSLLPVECTIKILDRYISTRKGIVMITNIPNVNYSVIIFSEGYEDYIDTVYVEADVTSTYSVPMRKE